MLRALMDELVGGEASTLEVDQADEAEPEPGYTGFPAPCVADRCRIIIDRRFLIEEDLSEQKTLDETGTPRKAETTTQGTDDQLSANELDWLRQRVGQCWNKPVAVKDADNLKVVVDFSLDINGFVKGKPVVEGEAIVMPPSRDG